jgi:hypothetical protein
MRLWNVRNGLAGAALIAGLLGACAALAQAPGDALLRGFLDPPDSAKPRVWWHWMNGNITKEGIKADLEWMKRTGIAGFQNFDAALNTPQVVDKRLVYMTPEWKDAFRYAASLADELGLEMAIAGSPGWSESGGPWVPPAQAMKKVVWSETRVEGGRPFHGMLPKPPSATGPFQNIPRGAAGAQEYYADTVVLAYREPSVEKPLSELQPKVTASGGAFSLTALTDGDLATATPLPAAPAGEKAWIQYEFAQPQSIQAATVVTRGGARGAAGPELETSADGQQFKSIAVIPTGGAAQHTIAFPPETARYFRLTFKAATAPATYQVSEFALFTGPRVNRFEEKAAFATAPELYTLATPPVAAANATPKGSVVDLTAKMNANGVLDWTPPEGRWVVLRMGFSLTGARNSPASPEATGLEVDKLNQRYVRSYLDTYLGMYKDTVGPLMGKRGLQYVVTDSWEAGVQNWTDEFIAEFTKRRGYDPRPFMPTLTGRVVESAEASDGFLWDYRKTIGELTTEYHYEQIGASLHERGMGRYTESHESGRAFIGDGMEVKRAADIPMSAMWTQRPGVNNEQFGYNADIRESASVAHIYGQNLVAAESMTAGGSAFAWSPETLKPTADKEMAMGLNRFVIHTSVHQPVNDKIPGLSLGQYGQWFTRHETWGGMAKPWTTYLARSSYMLQQGKFVADLLYFYGEDSNVTALFGSKAPEVPEGYNFDFVNADALTHKLAVEGGRITTPSGMSYRLLALDPRCQRMSLAALRKIRELVNGGASVVGAKPVASPSLGDDQAEFRKIADELWGAGPVGKGKVYGGQTIAAALSAMNVAPDFEYAKPQPDSSLLFVHRKVSDGEIYWVDNRSPRAETVDATFRVQGKAAEFWNAETGNAVAASYKTVQGRTTVPLKLRPYEAVFVVFRKPASGASRTVPTPVETVAATMEGPWEVSFQPERGAPAKATFDKLASWSESADAGVKYFSGIGTYARTVDAPAAWFKPGEKLWLELGDVKNLAEVTVNGKALGVAWLPPFRVDVTGALKPGANTVEIKVANLWVNRLVGDAQPNTAKKYTYTTQPFYRADSPLLPSGLLGPVRVVRIGGK